MSGLREGLYLIFIRKIDSLLPLSLFMGLAGYVCFLEGENPYDGWWIVDWMVVLRVVQYLIGWLVMAALSFVWCVPVEVDWRCSWCSLLGWQGLLSVIVTGCVLGLTKYAWSAKDLYIKAILFGGEGTKALTSLSRTEGVYLIVGFLGHG